MNQPAVNLDLPEADALSYSQLQPGEHFEAYELNGLFHWEASGLCEDIGLCNAEEHPTLEAATHEARELLALATAYGPEAALGLWDEYAEMMASFYPSDREAIEAAVKCMPIDDRFMAAYRMAKRTKPMQQARTFTEAYGIIIAAAVSAAIASVSLLPLPGSASPNYYQNGRWFTVENTAYYIRLDEWRKIRGRCYRLLSNHSVQERSAYRGTCEAPSGRG